MLWGTDRQTFCHSFAASRLLSVSLYRYDASQCALLESPVQHLLLLRRLMPAAAAAVVDEEPPAAGESEGPGYTVSGGMKLAILAAHVRRAFSLLLFSASLSLRMSGCANSTHSLTHSLPRNPGTEVARASRVGNFFPDDSPPPESASVCVDARRHTRARHTRSLAASPLDIPSHSLTLATTRSPHA